MLFKSLVSVALFAASAFAISLDGWPSTIEAGKTYTFTWSGADSTPVTLLLRKGEPTNLQTVGTITTEGTGGSYTWTAPTSFAPGTDYAIQIVQGASDNYSGQFSYTGGTAAAPSVPVVNTPSAAPSVAPASLLPSLSSAAILSTATVSSAVPFTNSTTTKSTVTSSSVVTSTRVSTSSTPSSTSAPNGNMASGLQSPAALILGVVAAMLYFQ